MDLRLLCQCIGRVSGSLSILGSFSIIYMVISDRTRKLYLPFHRLMLSMSVFDILHSIAIVISTAAHPQESTSFGGKGNMHTCATQGFFIVLGLAVPLYNSCLNIFFVLTIRYNISRKHFTKFEPALHAIAILVPLSMAIIFTASGHMVPDTSVCHPTGKFPIWTGLSVLMFCFIICITSMICICWTVISQAKKMEKYSSYQKSRNTSTRSRVNDDKKRTIKQAVLYTLSFILTYAFPILVIFYQAEKNGVPPTLKVLLNIFYPLQGFWNFIFYIRPGVQYVMRISPDKTYLAAILFVIFKPESTANGRSQLMRRRLPRRRRSSISSLRSNSRVKIVADSGPTSSLCQSNHLCSKKILNTRELDDLEVGHIGLSFTGLQAQTQQDTQIAEVGVIDEDAKQTNLQPRPKREPRRLSLVHIASILSPDDFEYNSDG